MKRKPRKMATFDAQGNTLGAIASDFTWYASSNPDFMEAQVPNDTPLPSDDSVVALMRDYPAPGVTTWMSPTQAAILSGKVQAAVDTIAATGAQLTSAGESIISAAAGIASNIVPILVALAALFIWIERGKR